jgi:hypothetical protein
MMFLVPKEDDVLAFASYRPLFNAEGSQPHSEQLFELNENEKEFQGLTDLLAPVTGVDAPQCWSHIARETAAGTVNVWVNTCRYQEPVMRGASEVDVDPVRSQEGGEAIAWGSRNQRLSKPPCMGGLVWEQVKLPDGAVRWENRVDRRLVEDKPSEAETLTLAGPVVDSGSDWSCVVM